MRNLFISFIVGFLLFSCSTPAKLSSSESEKFSLRGNEVFYENTAVAKMGPMEYEYNRGSFIVEVSLIQYAAVYDSMTEKIAIFMSSRYPDAKIEVKVPRDDQMDR